MCVGIRLKSWYIRWYRRSTNPADTNMAFSDPSGRLSPAPASSNSQTAADFNFGLCLTARSAGGSPIALREARRRSPSASIGRPAFMRRGRRGTGAKRLLDDGQDPSLAKKLSKAAKALAAANTFDVIAAELLDKKRREAKADRTIAPRSERARLRK